MNRNLLGLVAALSVASVGCGNICNRLDSAVEDRNAKKKNCSGISDSNFDPDQCNDNLSACSKSDQDALDNYAKCLGGLPECEPSAPLSFQAAELGCLQALQGTSSQCASSIGLF